MGKIRALYTNEMIKISRRPSVIIVAAATFIIALAFPFLMRVIYNNDLGMTENYNTRERFEQNLSESKAELANHSYTMAKENVTIEAGGKEKTVAMTKYSGNDFVYHLANKTVYEDILKNYDFEKFPINWNWLAMRSMSAYRSATERLFTMETTEFEERDAEWLDMFEKVSSARDSFRTAMLKHEYEPLCKGFETLNSLGINDETHSPDIIRRLSTTDPEGKLEYTAASLLMGYLEDRDTNQKILDSGLEDSMSLPRIVTDERREILKNSNLILEYKFNKHNTYSEASMIAIMADYYSEQVARYGLVILLVLIAGSSVSQELATGSIKSLIIAPVKRWKIFTAKLLSIISWMLAASILLALFAIIGTGIAFGFENLPPYLYVSGGNVVEMPFVFAMILITLVQNIPAFFYAFAAFMISCFTKNTGVSVGVSIGLLLFHEVPTILQSSEVPQRFLDFTPVANMDLVEKVFPYINLMVSMDEMEINLFSGYGFNNPLWSMVLYNVVLAFTVLLIAFEEFTKKDIA